MEYVHTAVVPTIYEYERAENDPFVSYQLPGRESWTTVNRTYGIHKNLYIYLFFLTIFGPIYYGPL